MYIVKKYHYRPAYRKGDLEDETVMIGAYTFNTRKEAKAYIERELQGRKDVTRNYKKGKEASLCTYWTGKTWVHENTGETCREDYTYILENAKYPSKYNL